MNRHFNHRAKRLDIAFVGTLPPCQTGASIVCLQVLDGLARRGHRLRAWAPITPEFESVAADVRKARPAIDLQWFPMPGFEPFPSKPAPASFRDEERRQIGAHLGPALRDAPPDLVLIGRETYAWVATELARPAGVPALLYVHGGASTAMADGSYPKAAQAKLLDHFRAADQVVTMAGHWAATLQRLGIANARAVRNPVALDRFAAGNRDRSLRQALALPDNAVVVLHASHLGPIKRCRDIVRSAVRACAADDRLFYVIVGDGQGLSDIKSFSETAGVNSRFRFVGWVPHDQMPHYLNLADLVVMPSEAEVQSLVYLEAMACEKVLIASDIPAAREIMTNGHSGFLFATGDIERLTGLTLELAGSPNRRAAIGREARRRVVAHDLDMVVAEHERILADVAGVSEIQVRPLARDPVSTFRIKPGTPVPSDICALIDTCGSERVEIGYDDATDAWIFVVLDDSRRGPAAGGTRMKVYPRPALGLTDALRLAAAMSAKWAVVDIPRGGGKGVIALSRPLAADEREGLLRRYGQFVGRLGGAFTTGIDLGTSADDLRVVAEETDHVHAFFRDRRYQRALGEFTARGVVAALNAAIRHRTGSSPPSGLRATVQGLGGVGAPLANLLAASGFRLRVADTIGARARDFAERAQADMVDPDDVFDCDGEIFVPCADGGVLNQQSIGRLRVGMVVGAANNQLGGAAAVRQLHRRKILYVPDFLANAGAAIAVDCGDRGLSETDVGECIGGIDRITTEILADASKRDEPPLFSARRRVAAAFSR